MNLLKIFTFLAAIATLTAQGQIGKKTDQKAKDKSDKAYAEEAASDDAGAGEAVMKMMGSSDADVEDEYQFDHRFLILMEDFNKKGKLNSSNEMTFLAKDKSSVMGVRVNQEGMNTEMIYDLDNFEMITLMNTGGQKIGTTMSIDRSQVERMKSESDSEKEEMGKMPTFKKTGETKMISGYSCDEYVLEDAENGDGSTMTYWITDELEIDWIKSMSNMSSMNERMPEVYADSGYPKDGSVIQMITEQKNGERIVMTVKEAETDQDITISTKGYTFMNIGGR